MILRHFCRSPFPSSQLAPLARQRCRPDTTLAPRQRCPPDGLRAPALEALLGPAAEAAAASQRPDRGRSRDRSAAAYRPGVCATSRQVRPLKGTIGQHRPGWSAMSIHQAAECRRYRQPLDLKLNTSTASDQPPFSCSLKVIKKKVAQKKHEHPQGHAACRPGAGKRTFRSVMPLDQIKGPCKNAPRPR